MLLTFSCLFSLELDLTCGDLKVPEAQILNWIAINIPQNLESFKLFSTYIVANYFFDCQVPKLFDKQGGQLLAVALLVFSRTWISDRIASLNGMMFDIILFANYMD